MTEHPLRLTAEQVRHTCSIEHFPFKTTQEIEFVQTIIGQPRGVRAIEFGIDIETPGFNIYILGPTGTGRTTAIRHFLESNARQGNVPPDWVYVYNFEVEHQPRAIELPPGMGSTFCDDMNRLLEVLYDEIPQTLEAEEFTQAMETLEEGANARRDEMFQAFSAEAREQGFTVIRTPSGLLLPPIDEDGQPMPPEKIQELDKDVRAELEKKHEALQGRLADSLREVRDLEREHREDQNRLKRVAAAFVIDQHIGDLKERYAGHEEVNLYLTQVREDVLEHLEEFSAGDEDENAQAPPQMPGQPGPGSRHDLSRRYAVNLIVDHSKTEGAPVVVEDLPSYASLVGRIEGEVRLGALHTDFTMIKPGSLHRANGGYLVLRVARLLTQPGAWEGLKSALTSGELRIQESMIRSGLGILTPQTVDPEPIPLRLKVILLGSPTLYYALYGLEEDFSDLFKIKADFASTMERTPETEIEYATFIAARCHESDLPHFNKAAVGEIIEYGARMAEHQHKLSTLFGLLTDVIHEATYWTQKDGQDVVDAGHVLRAIEERRYRSNLYEERTLENIEEGTIFIDTTGEVLGQVNGLSVIGLGDYTFGQPSRITARVYAGKDGVINIEREVELSGPIHDKGVLILHGYLGGQYALDRPLTLSASITFEQSYGGVEGDSATFTELAALLSALSDHPIKQMLAATGSVNQRGQIQPIGGVNEKIEGFFQVCQARGLTGDQGVLIPRANVPNLMLHTEVLDAMREGKFHVYTIETVDQGIELLLGIPAGERQPDGTFPEGTLHHAVHQRLQTLAESVKEAEKSEE
jgi:lon-related putative ATP-dependent protease